MDLFWRAYWKENRLWVITLAFCGLVLAFGFDLYFYLSFRQWPYRYREPLFDVKKVAKMEPDGLILQDGTKVKIPGLESHLNSSSLISRIVRPGVEVTETGRVVGLIGITVDCGNDPRVENIQRVDVGYLAEFLNQKSDPPNISGLNTVPYHRSGAHNAWGWFHQEENNFRRFCAERGYPFP